MAKHSFATTHGLIVFRTLALLLLFSPELWISPQPLAAQGNAPSPATQRLLERIADSEWTYGPAQCQIADIARIQIPKGYKFIGASGARALIELYGNPPDNTCLAAILPMDGNFEWSLFFEFDEIGYVKDEEKNSLNGDAILSEMRQSIGPQNAERRRLGLEELQNMSWSKPPFYDPVTNNLNWGLQLQFPSGSSVNYDIRLLGRYGVMKATLLDSPETYAQSVQTVNYLLGGFEFVNGQKYAEWKAGDKVAAYGLTGLVAGGAAVAVANMGLLAKLGALIAKGGKGIIVILAAIGFGLLSFLKRFFGGKHQESRPPAN